MTNLVIEVWGILDDSPYVRRAMSHGLINTRALARYIIRERKIDATIDAVISAIRRYELGRCDRIFEDAHRMMAQIIAISTKSPLADISLIKDIEIQKLLPQLFSVIHYNQGAVLRVIQTDESIKILVDEKNREEVKTLFPESKIIRIDRNLAEINIHQHPDAKNTPGTLAIMSNELAINGINILEAMSCISELLWFVEEKDLLRAYNILNRFWQLNQKLYHKDDQAT